MTDTLVVTVALALIATPFLPTGRAAGPLIERGITVDQRVKPTAMISMPIDGDFQVPRSGKSVGSVKWDVYTTSREGYKLAVHARETPALWDDAPSKAQVDDYDRTAKAWSVGPGERRFGFSASGSRALDVFGSDNNLRWRGFNGKRPIEVARYRNGSVPISRTTVWLAAEMRNPLPAGAQIDGLLVATAMVNL